MDRVLLETGLRGGALAVLVVLAISGLPAARRSVAGRTTLLFDLCAMAFLVETAPGLQNGLAAWVVPLRLLSNATPGVFVAWGEAAFTDAPTPWRWGPFATMLALAGSAMATGSPLAWAITHATALLLVLLGTIRVLAGRTTDLVEGRRRARLVFACGVGLTVAATTVLGALGAGMLPALSAVLGIALAAALFRLRAIPPDSAPNPLHPVAAPPAVTPEERHLALRLHAAMDHDRAYREPGLTVAALAARLGVPEYRLRRLINGHLGHRSFTVYLNAHRLAEAQAALLDPAQVRVPVLTIALDAGWGSIGPFNRAFKAHTGQTPTEFRRRARAGFPDVADSRIGQASQPSASTPAPCGKTAPHRPGQPPRATRRTP